MSEKLEQRVLRALATTDDELYGLELIAAGVVSRWWPGALYVELARMESKGLIEGREEDPSTVAAGRLPRRVYRITDAGRAKLVTTVPPARLL